MRICKEFELINIEEVNVIVPLGAKNVDFDRMITLNGSGAFLWRQLQEEKTEQELLNAMLEEYDTDEATALVDIKTFVGKLKEAEIISE